MQSLGRHEDDFMEDVFLQEGLCPTIAEHATQCNTLFKRYMTMTEIVPDPTIMDDQLARFTLWASNMDVYGPPNVSLDYRLRFSPTVVGIIHQLLDIICDTLISLKPIEDPPPSPSRKRQRTSIRGDSAFMGRTDDESDLDSNMDDAEENVSKITDTIGGTVTRLFRLSNAVRKSAKANRAHKIEKYTTDKEANRAIDELRRYTECYIQFRFPMAPDVLRLALIEANALRLRRLYYQRSHRRRIDLSVQHPEHDSVVLQLPAKKERAPAVRFAPSVLPKLATSNIPSGQTGTVPVPATNATTARQTAVGAFYAKSTTEVPRAKSVAVNNKLSFPPIPPTDECPYCGVIIEFKSTAKKMLWQNHVIGDLEPFVCVFSQCLETIQRGTSPLTFETSKAWLSHMQNAHGHTWECRAPSHDPITFSQETDHEQHSIEEHGVPASHAGTLSSAARRPALEKVLECPFGDNFHPPKNSEPSPVFLSEALQLHVAAHIKEIALLTLQKLPSDMEGDTENVDSDQVLDDGGAGFPKLRGSMYSVLEDEDLNFEDGTHAEDHLLGESDEDVRPSASRLDPETDGSGKSKLHHAVLSMNPQLVASLISEGANLGHRDEQGRTALHYVSMTKAHDSEVMNLLLQASTKAIVNQSDNNGQTALFCATERERCPEMQGLLEHDADVGIADKHGVPPLLWAVVSGRPLATTTLLQWGADPNSTSGDGKSALSWAVGLGHLDIVRILVVHNASPISTAKARTSPLGEAAASGILDTVQLLLDAGVDLNHRDRDGWSAIHWAADEGHGDIVDLLLSKGANINAISSYGTTPLHCAANGGHIAIVRQLLLQGADPLVSTCHGWTALHHAAYMGHPDTVECLLGDDRVVARASQQDNHGWSALHLAVHSRDLSTVKTLLGSSVISESRALFDESGLTAEEWLDLRPTSHTYKATCNLAFAKSRCCRAVTGLGMAVLSGNILMVRHLLNLGFDVNSLNSGRQTALYHAAKSRMFPIMDLLLAWRADPNILPSGRKSWEEFMLDDDEVISRFKQFGYSKPNVDLEVERQIRFALREPRQYSFADRSVPVSHSHEETGPPMLNRSIFSLPDRSASSVASRSSSNIPDNSKPKVPILSPKPTDQLGSHKRKAESGRSGVLKLWRRWMR